MLETATLDWQTDTSGKGVPISTAFDDIYFSKENGLAESRYVFGENNHLPERFLACFSKETAERFVIAETGFGTGLNFLMSCALWATAKKNSQSTAPLHRSPTLHFISTEKFPLKKDDLEAALAHWQDEPALAPFVTALLTAYPPALAGCHRRYLGADLGLNIVLDLWLGDASESLHALADAAPWTKVDAWFLDGFAPKKNESLWSDTVFSAIARLSHKDSTLATFSAAGQVKRGLLAINATPLKTKGFGRKREMLTARFETFLEKPAQRTPHVAVIGAGVAGLCSAYALARHGCTVTLIDKVGALAGASGNFRALLSPKLSDIKGVKDHLPTAAFLYAQAHYETLTPRTTPHPISPAVHSAVFEKTGVIDFLLPSNKPKEKHLALIDSYPDTLICHHAPLGTAELCAYLPDGGQVNPAALAEVVLAHPAITLVKDDPAGETPLTYCQTHYQADSVLICAGYESRQLHPAIFDCRKIRGQASILTNKTAVQAFKDAAHASIKYDGYACVSEDTLLFGASFVRNSTDTSVRADEHRFNLDKLTHALPHAFAKLGNIDEHSLEGRAGIRAQTPDYHPITGKIEQQLYLNTAMGSKGYSFAPLCAEIIAALITHAPMPTTQAVLEKISPDRPRLKQPLDHSR